MPNTVVRLLPPQFSQTSCLILFQSKALAGRCGITDWILHTDDTSSDVSLLKLLPFAILNHSPVKCFKNGGTCGLHFPCHSPVSRMFSNLYLSRGVNSTRKQISGFLNFLDLIKGAPSVLTTIKSAFFPLAQGSCWMNFWYTLPFCMSLMQSSAGNCALTIL